MEFTEYRRPLSTALQDYTHRTELIEQGLQDCTIAVRSMGELTTPARGQLFACVIVAREYWRLRGDGLAEHLAYVLHVGVEEAGVRQGLVGLLRRLDGMGLEDGLPDGGSLTLEA